MGSSEVREIIRKELNILKTFVTNDIKLEIQLLRTELMAKLNEITTTLAYVGTEVPPPVQVTSNPNYNLQEFELLEVKEVPFDVHPVSVDEDDTELNNDSNDIDDYASNYENYDGVIFPIQLSEELDKIEKEIRTGAKDKYVAEFTNLLKAHGLINILDKIFSEKFITELNMEGMWGKIPLKEYTYFLDALYDAVREVEPNRTYDDFIASMRVCFRLYKSKIYNKNYSNSKSKKDPAENAEPSKTAMNKSIDAILQLAESQMQENEPKYKKRYTFPLKTFAEIEHLNAIIDDTNRKEYIQTLRTFLSLSGLRQNLDRFMDKELIMHYNFGGQQGKLPFKVYTNLLGLLYDALVHDKERTSEKDFHQEIMYAFKAFKNRIHKKNCEERQGKRKKQELKTVFSTINNDDSQDYFTPLVDPEEESANQIPPMPENGKKYKHKFPLKTPFNLEMMNKMITPENRHKYVKKLRDMIKYGGVHKNFTRFMSPELILQYNVKGMQRKRSFQELTNVVDVLFEAATDLKEGCTLDSFLSELSVVFSKQKNIIHKKVCLEKKKQRESMRSAEILRGESDDSAMKTECDD